jgi:hypothetical protein
MPTGTGSSGGGTYFGKAAAATGGGVPAPEDTQATTDTNEEVQEQD